jgi:hypothetical protein
MWYTRTEGGIDLPWWSVLKSFLKKRPPQKNARNRSSYPDRKLLALR